MIPLKDGGQVGKGSMGILYKAEYIKFEDTVTSQ